MKTFIKSTIITLILVLSSFSIEAQINGYDAHQTTSLTGGRYEIIQSDIAAIYSFLLDKYEGKVYQLVKTKKGTLAWEEMYKMPCDSDTRIPGKINYQLFLSGLAAKFTFLLNINTGQTWVLVNNTTFKAYIWEPILDIR